MKKLASLALGYNSEKFIYPHLEMLDQIDKVVVVLPNKPFRAYKMVYSDMPDRTREIINKNFPNVQIVDYEVQETGDDAFSFPALYNFGLNLLKDYDLVTLLDVDILLTKKDWKKLINVLQASSAEFFVTDFSRDSVDYYGLYDFEHGVYDQVEIYPIAVNPKYEIGPYLKVNAIPEIISDITFHHFRNWKAVDNMFNLPTDNLIKCPRELQNSLLSWREKLEAL